MSNLNVYFLARSGKIAGPYTEGDLRTLETRGELLKYSWIWAPGASDWKPLDPKPAHAPSLKSESVQSDDALPMEAYALWGQSAIRGRIESRTELGFELVYTEKRMLPALAKGMSLQIMEAGTVADNASLALMKIAEIQKKGDQWVLFLRHR